MAKKPKVDVGLCVKDGDGRVIDQNEQCLKVCGDQKGHVCDTGCMSMRSVNEANPELTQGVQLFRNKKVGGEFHDVVLIDEGDKLTTFLYPLDAKYEEELRLIKQHGLSPREMEIMALVVRGVSNTEIAKKLHISRSTLKTHLNNIYRKLPVELSGDLKKRAQRKDSV